jgi:ornithine carbamoyltransferase
MSAATPLRHFLSLADYSPEEIRGLLDLAKKVKSDPAAYRDALDGKKIALIFEKPSTRTRVSFEAGMADLGGKSLVLSSVDLQLGRGETVADTAQVLSRYVDGVMARVFHQKTLEDLATGTIPVINGLSDLLHPCQALADLLTLEEKRGGLAGQKMTYVGDGNNVAHSLIHICAKMGVAIHLACPEGHDPDEKILNVAKGWGGHVEVMRDPGAAVQGADAVYTDVWASMGQEAEAEERRTIFSDYQVNGPLFGKAKPDAIFLHCLPAHRGEEVTNEVVDHERSVVFDQAENRLHAQKALMLFLLGGVALS